MEFWFNKNSNLYLYAAFKLKPRNYLAIKEK